MYKLLIVDDEMLERRVLKMIISTKINTVEIVGEAENGRKAIQLSEQFAPDIIIMDIKMPGVDGIEAVKIIKQQNKDVKIIMLSAFNTFEYARQVMQQGVKEYLVKPARKDELVTAIERVVSELEKENQEKEEQRSILEKLQRERVPGETDWQLHSDHRKMQKVKSFIEDHFTKTISLEDAAEYVDISPYYLSKLFKEQFSINFIDYVTQLRVERAKELMKNPDRSLKEICYDVGYKDPNYFSRVFKKITGFSPSEYRSRVHSSFQKHRH
ncbi:response regulator [Neobacillus niacini]|uniref:response regulator transcription factor n=1 Tax=Neobacillus niacini TaxID=86668 RepID=UPI0021CB18D0|nr:response regulator [Neobacillus niacini]MCM3767804.1 response regulator [Neobacillus niacini]